MVNIFISNIFIPYHANISGHNELFKDKYLTSFTRNRSFTNGKNKVVGFNYKKDFRVFIAEFDCLNGFDTLKLNYKKGVYREKMFSTIDDIYTNGSPSFGIRITNSLFDFLSRKNYILSEDTPLYDNNSEFYRINTDMVSIIGNDGTIISAFYSSEKKRDIIFGFVKKNELSYMILFVNRSNKSININDCLEIMDL
jgi:hypothetical protein